MKATCTIRTVFVLAMSAHPLGVGAFAQAQVASNGGTGVVGEWSGETFSGGVGTRLLLNLYANGTYSQRSTIVTEYGWTLEGETLLMAPVVERGDDMKYGKAMALGVKLEGDSLIATANRQRIVLRRQTAKVPHSPILGRWEGMSDLNEPITQDFTADGRLIITVVMKREAGRYSLARNEITWEEQIPSPKRRHRTRYRLAGDTLTLVSPSPLPSLELTRVQPFGN
jgi:hypothetical protein